MRLLSTAGPIAIAVVAAACTGAEPDPGSTAATAPATGAPAATSPVASTTPLLSNAPVAILPPEELSGAAFDFLERRSVEGLVSLIRSMGATGDPRWGPYLLDLRLLAGEEAFGELQAAFGAVSGLPPPERRGELFVHYGTWVYDAAIDPGDEYVPWKAELYSLIDDEFGELIRHIGDPVLAGRLQWGGVTVGGIPELDHPRTISVAEADYMTPDELTFGAVINGEARAYPHRILDFHELANDTLGGEPVALANCTLCRTGMLFSRRVGDLILDFQTSGLLWNSNKVMVDVQTRTLWRQLTGEAIAGELEGEVLEAFPLTVTLYADWIAEHPDTDILAIPGGGRDLDFGGGAIPQDFGYSYEPNQAYRDYYAGEDLWFPSFAVPDRFEEKERVATLTLDGAAIAVGVEDLAVAGPHVLEVGGARVLAVPTAAGARFYLVTDDAVLDAADGGGVTLPPGSVIGEEQAEIGGATLERLTSSQSFWFAWYGIHPDTAVWP